MKRILLALLVILALIPACAPAAQPAVAPTAPAQPAAEPTKPAERPAQSTDPVVIGAAVALTGFVTAWDVPATNFLELAIEDINAAGGINGRQFKLVRADMKSDPALGANAALEVIDKGAQVVMVTCDFDMGSPAAFAAVEKGLLVFSSCAASTKFGVEGIGPLAFTMSTAAPAQGAIMAEWAYKERGYKTAYILLDDTADYMKQVAAAFEARFAELAGKDAIVGKDIFKNPDTSIASQITRFKSLATEPDCILFASHPPGGASALRQIRAAGIETPILSTESMDGNYWIDAVPTLSDFYYAAYASLWGDDPYPKFNELMDRYEERFGERPTIGNGITGYSVGEAIARAAEKSGSFDGKALQAVLEAFDKEPLIVGPTTFTPELHINLNRPMRIIQVQNGKYSFVTEYGAEKVPELK